MDLSPENEAILKELPKCEENVWKYFLLTTQVPHPSKFLGPMRDFLQEFAKKHELYHLLDKAGNVLIRRAASKSAEGAPTVILQCHMDMVGSHNSDIEHDWHRDPLHLEIDGQWLTAKGTTLGADDGIGIAACLDILSDQDITVGPIECLFTTDEEDDMSGAENLSSDLLTGDLLINVDSEEENSICVGCAGGFESKLFLPAPRTSVDLTKYGCLEVKLHGLLGGHTGCDINLGRGNALMLLGRIVSSLQEICGVRLTKFYGGTAINAIPREATAELLVPLEKVEACKSLMHKTYDIVKEEYASVEQRDGKCVMKFDVSKNDCDGKNACDEEVSKKILHLSRISPHGVIRMSPDVKDLVETSVASPFMELQESEFFVHLFARSSRDSAMDDFHQQLQGLASLTGSRISEKMINFYPGWQPNSQSKLVKIVEDCHVSALGREATVYAVHAGLECGFIFQKYPKMDQVSIGPTITGAHSPDEQVEIETVTRFMKWLRKCLEAISK